MILGSRHFAIVVMNKTLYFFCKVFSAEVIDPFVAIRSNSKRVIFEDYGDIAVWSCLGFLAAHWEKFVKLVVVSVG